MLDGINTQNTNLVRSGRDFLGYTDEEYMKYLPEFARLIAKHTGSPVIFCKKALERCSGNPFRAKEFVEKYWDRTSIYRI